MSFRQTPHIWAIRSSEIWGFLQPTLKIRHYSSFLLGLHWWMFMSAVLDFSVAVRLPSPHLRVTSQCVQTRSGEHAFKALLFVCLLLSSTECELPHLLVEVHWSRKKDSLMEPCLLFFLPRPGHVPLSSPSPRRAGVTRPWAELQLSLARGNGLVSGLIRGRSLTD